MITATFTQFRNNAASYFDKVGQGQTIEIFRKGKPAAVLSPVKERTSSKEHWKQAKPLFDLGSDIASRMLIQDRRRGH